MNTEKLQNIISLIGERHIEMIYDLTGGEKISFAALHRQLQLERVKKLIDEGRSFKQIAKDCGVSRMTVYRVFRSQIKRKSHK